MLGGGVISGILLEGTGDVAWDGLAMSSGFGFRVSGAGLRLQVSWLILY